MVGMQVYIFGISTVCNIHSYSFIVISKYCLHTHTASRVCVCTLGHSLTRPFCLTLDSWLPSAQLLEGMSPGREPQRIKTQSTSKEFHWLNMIINRYPLSVQVLPQLQASLT